ncbi:MAG TPA: C25 family peptidase propeptide domain-containing protein, partial [Bacteroidota bacterium]|nr:C25 family peptidase propeptide domain-containing protein [Bacteroidota bacterium]
MRTFISILLLATSVAFAQIPGDFKILNEDNHSITVEFVPQFQTQTLKRADGTALQRTAFTGEIIEHNRAGDPWISYRALLLQFPTSRAAVTVVSAESHQVDGMRPLPVPRMKPDEKFGFSPVYESTLTVAVPVYHVAALSDVAPSQGKYVGTLKLYPVVYDQQSGNATVYTRIVVQVTFDPWTGNLMKASRPVPGMIQPGGIRVAPRSAKRVVNDSPLAQGTWYKMEIRETGIYKIDQAFLQKAGISLSAVGNINSIRVFGNGGRMLPEDLSQPRPDGLVEVARHVVDNNANGQFDADDCVLFYGRSTRGWDYNPLNRSYTHYFSYYSEPDYYFLTFGSTTGIEMDTIASTSVAGAYTPPDFQEKMFLKQDRYNLFGSGRQWVGQQFDGNSSSAVYSNTLPGYVAGTSILYRFAFASR